MGEESRVLLFIGSVVIIYVLAAVILIRWLLRKFNLISFSESRRQKWFARIILALAGVGVLCVVYGYFVEPYWLSVSQIQIKSSKLPRGSRPVRIVHIS